jgi:prefoldin subunit 4
MGYALADNSKHRDILTRLHAVVEDQQRINTFSKLNTRYRTIEEKLESLKARLHVLASCCSKLMFVSIDQQEKDVLDDLSTELELADEDESVM